MDANASSNGLRRAREARGLSMNDVALRIGVTVGAVAHWERGRNVPFGPSRLLLAQLFEVPVDVVDGWFDRREAA